MTGGRCFGYVNERIAGHVERRIVEAEAAIVRRIFQLAAAGVGKVKIAKRLNAEGAAAPLPRGVGRPRGWAGSTVREVLHRELYRGEIVWAKTKKRGAGGELDRHNRPGSDWLHVDAPHLRIVPEALWRAAHARLAANRCAHEQRSKGQQSGRPVDQIDRKHLLVGLARCKACGGSIEVNSRRHGRSRVPLYACATHRRRGACVCAGLDVIPKEQVDEAVLDTIATQLFAPARVDRVCRDVVAHFAAPARSAAARRQQLQQRRRELEAGISRLVDAIAGGEACAPIVDRIRTSERERAEVDRELVVLEATAAGVVTETTVRKVLERLFVEWQRAILEAPTNVALARARRCRSWSTDTLNLSPANARASEACWCGCRRASRPPSRPSWASPRILRMKWRPQRQSLER